MTELTWNGNAPSTLGELREALRQRSAVAALIGETGELVAIVKNDRGIFGIGRSQHFEVAMRTALESFDAAAAAAAPVVVS